MIQFKKHSGIFTLEWEQQLKVGLDEAWQFFSNPGNLKKITPSHMGFSITSGKPKQMYAGQIISYKVAVLPGIYTNWVTEISHVVPLKYFVDEQRFGPYGMWHHEHWFEQNENGVLISDKISYKVPLGFLGGWMNRWLIKGQLYQIFEYRYRCLEYLFNGAY